MKLKICLILLIIPFISDGQEIFNKYFINKSLRFDFLLGGDSENVQVYPAQIKQEPYWAGSQKNLKDTFNYGTYRFRVFDFNSDSLIFLKGFSTFFSEWQTTAEAGLKTKTFYQVVIFPYPRKKIKLTIDTRQWNGKFKSIFSTTIDPSDYFIVKEIPNPFKTVDIVNNGKSENKVDVAILAEGYTVEEMNKFLKDAQRMTSYLFDEEPFKMEKNKFNVVAVLTPSVESGTDIPGEGIYKNTCFNSTFYTFDVPRYLTTTDMKSICDAAANVPYDHIYILVNTDRYGGGGFYNLLSIGSADNERTRTVITHEFGHGFAGLGDEYYTSQVAYKDFYNLKAEPWEPNLTTLVDFNSKWKSEIDNNVPVPTPRKQEYSATIGVFEGGGYMERGIYVPYFDCRMKSNTANGFCPVCQQAIKKVIDFYTK